MDQQHIRTLYITGTSRGIGRALAETAVSDPDFRVHGFARGKGPKHPAYAHHQIDLSSFKELSEFHFPTPGQSEQIVLINNAGVLGKIDYLGNLDPQELAMAIQVNLLAPTILMNCFLHQFKDNPAKKLIINLSSGAGKNPYDGWSSYCATKAGLDMLTRVAALEQEQLKLKFPFIVKAIAPGVVETVMQQTIRASEPQNFSRKEKFMDLHESGSIKTVSQCAAEFVAAIKDNFSKYELIDKI